MAKEFLIISKPGCPACINAKAALTVRGIDYDEDVRDTPEGIQRFIAEGHRTFPRIFRFGELLGGNDDLQAYLNPRRADDDDF